jgi:hypothetical protein
MYMHETQSSPPPQKKNKQKKTGRVELRCSWKGNYWYTLYDSAMHVSFASGNGVYNIE